MTRASASLPRAAVQSVQLSARTSTWNKRRRIIDRHAAPDRRPDAFFLVMGRDHNQETSPRHFLKLKPDLDRYTRTFPRTEQAIDVRMMNAKNGIKAE